MSHLSYSGKSASPENVDSVFDLWSEVYDSQLNPLLMLEERIALTLLPPIVGCNVLDAGCGTGRWLVRLEQFGPASLAGADSSPAMLARCRNKVSNTTQLHLCECSLLPIGAASQSLTISSFVLSYLDDLSAFAEECARVTQLGGSLIVSDLHPRTIEDLGWTRSFQIIGPTSNRTIDVAFRLRPLHEIVATFENHGFTLVTHLEPCFGIPEQSVFAAAGKLAVFDSLAEIPAIYVLRFERKREHPKLALMSKTPNLQITASFYAANPSDWKSGVVEIQGDRITSLGSRRCAITPTIDLSEYLLLPGLINAHDHLDFGLFPNLGRRESEEPYRNATEWAKEIHIIHAKTIKHFQGVPKATRLWWGAIRNLLCGVTTVCHHNPLYEDLHRPEFPVRVVTQFGWSHSLVFDEHLLQKFQDSSKTIPFILHAAEGVDAAAQEEIFNLDRSNLLDNHTVLIHGLGLTHEALSLLNRRGAALIVCPTTTQFLFGQVLSPSLLTTVCKLAIGSDSSITAKGDLLDEVEFLRSNSSMRETAIYNLVTTNPANILHLQNGEGYISQGGIADMIAIRGHHQTPAAAVFQLTVGQVELVLLSGRVQMASDEVYTRLPQAFRAGMQPLDLPGYRRWIRAPLQELFSQAQSVLGKGNLFISGRQVQYAGAL